MKTRLAKFLADSGVASRRESERLIEQGAVTVNGAIITTPVFFVTGTEEIKVKGHKAQGIGHKVQVFAFHKPINTITSASDPSGRTTIYDILQKNNYALCPMPCALKYVGRLDYKTTGLLLLTNDGELARRLTLPSSNIKRVYIATLHPKPMNGIKNPNLTCPTKPCNKQDHFDWRSGMRKFLSPTATDDSIFDALRRGAVINKIKYAPMEIEVTSRYPITVKITLTQGKKNEIRIAMDHVGFMVKKLHRVSYGPIQLGDLPPGALRELTRDEIKGIGHRA